MLPNLRFTIGAILVSALLIVSAFGMAANVRIAHHRAVGPLEAARILAYADPTDWSSRPAAPRRVIDAADDVTLLEHIASIPLDPAATMLASKVGEHELPDDSTSATQPAEVSIPLIPVFAGTDPSDPGSPTTSTSIDERAATADESTMTEGRAKWAQAAVLPVPKGASLSATNATKRVVKKRRLPSRAKVPQPAATASTPVTYDGANFDGPYFGTGSSMRASATCATGAWHCRSGF